MIGPHTKGVFRVEDEEGVTTEVPALDTEAAAYAWAHGKGHDWWAALPWNGTSQENMRYYDIFIKPPEHAEEWLVTWDSDTGQFYAMQAP